MRCVNVGSGVSFADQVAYSGLDGSGSVLDVVTTSGAHGPARETMDKCQEVQRET